MLGSRTLRFLLLAAAVATLSPDHIAAEGTTSDPLRAGVTACQFDALGNPPNGQDLVVRDAPGNDGRVLGPLPAVEVEDFSSTGSHREAAQLRVIGFKDGWFLVEDAQYPTASQSPPYTGRAGSTVTFVTTQLFRDTPKKTPSYIAEDIVYLYGVDADGFPGTPYNFPLKRITGCSGPWFEVEAWLPGAKTPSGKPAPGSGKVRGWTDRSCVQQDQPCEEKQFDYPWSPLPAGVTECKFRALSRDPDPAGLNLPESPDKNARKTWP